MKVSIAVMFALLLPCFVKADTVLLGTHGDTQFGLLFQQNQYLAQQFTFPNGASLSSTKLTFIDNFGPAFNGVFQVVDSLGPSSTAANVLFTSGINLPSSEVFNPTIVIVPTPLTVAAGTYYLLLSTTDPLPLQTRWIFGTSTLPGTSGIVGDLYFSISPNIALPVASPFSLLQAFPKSYFNFQIEGSPIPEPSTPILLGIAAISLLGYRKARSHG